MAAPRREGSLTITQHPGDPIVIDCQKCGHSGRNRKATLIEKYGSDTVLSDLIGILADACEFRGRLGNQGCGAIYPALMRVPRRKLPLKLV